MAVLWQLLTFSATPREVSDPAWGEVIRLKPHQILLWVSLAHRGLNHLPPATPRLPLPLLGLAALCAGSLTVELPCAPAGGTVRISTAGPKEIP